jgi:hypothetical protein
MNQAFRAHAKLTVQASAVFSEERVVGTFSSPEAALQVVHLLINPNWTPTRDFLLTVDDWNQCRAAGIFTGQGYFVDWNGKVHDLQNLGPHFSYTAIVDVEKAHVSVIEHDGGEIHTADYHPTLESLEARGVIVNRQ